MLTEEFTIQDVIDAEKEESREEGIEIGKEVGREEGILEVAVKMLKKKTSLEIIMELTGLDKATLERLEKDIARSSNTGNLTPSNIFKK